MPHGWVLVGGQAVYLHAIERGAPFVRPTKDADMALDIRAYPTMLHDFTALLVKLDFESAGESHEGHQHRRKRGDAIVDVLIPRFLGERADNSRGVTGGTMRGVTYQPAERSHLATMLGYLANNPDQVSLVPEGAPGVERLRMSLS